MATWGRPVTGHGRSERVTRDSETARLPHAGPGGRHLESLNPPAFHRRITLLKPRHFAPPSQALTPSPRKPCLGAPQTCSTPDSHCPNIQNLRALFFNHLQLFIPESPKSPLYPQSRTGWGTPWVRLPPSEARTREPPICQHFVKLKLTAATPKNPPAPALSQAKPLPHPPRPSHPTRRPSSRRLYPLHPKLLHPKLASFRRPPFPPRPSRRPPCRIPAGRRLSVPLPLPCALRFATLASKRIVHPLPRRTLEALYEQKRGSMVQEAEGPRCGTIAKITVTSFKSIEKTEGVSKTARLRNHFMTAMQALPPS